MKYSVFIPIRTRGGLNAREHHFARSRRVKAEREAAGWVTPRSFPLPCVVTLTRLSAGTPDSHDNLRGCLKGIVDGIADRFGIKDNDPRIEWRYAQRKCSPAQYGVQIELESVPC